MCEGKVQAYLNLLTSLDNEIKSGRDLLVVPQPLSLRNGQGCLQVVEVPLQTPEPIPQLGGDPLGHLIRALAVLRPVLKQLPRPSQSLAHFTAGTNNTKNRNNQKIACQQIFHETTPKKYILERYWLILLLASLYIPCIIIVTISPENDGHNHQSQRHSECETEHQKKLISQNISLMVISKENLEAGDNTFFYDDERLAAPKTFWGCAFSWSFANNAQWFGT